MHRLSWAFRLSHNAIALEGRASCIRCIQLDGWHQEKQHRDREYEEETFLTVTGGQGAACFVQVSVGAVVLCKLADH
jgi:hypothetical protein